MKREDFLTYIDGVVQEILPGLQSLESAREEVLKVNREIIFNSSKAIESVHAERFDEALQYLLRARSQLLGVEEDVERGKDVSLLRKILDSGQREFVEAVLTYSFACSVSPDDVFGEMELKPVSYVMGILDFAGELRRLFLDALIEGDFGAAETALKIMKRIYSALVGLDIRVSMLPGFKKRLDIVRNQIERSTENLYLSRVSRKIKGQDVGEGEDTRER
ncbi:MAG: hypothetical protein ACE5GD_06100 [Candidatus Geothermarchaeales archaeon]